MSIAAGPADGHPAARALYSARIVTATPTKAVAIINSVMFLTVRICLLLLRPGRPAFLRSATLRIYVYSYIRS